MDNDRLLTPIPEIVRTGSSSDESSSASGGDLQSLLRSHSLTGTTQSSTVTPDLSTEKKTEITQIGSSSESSHELPGIAPVFFQLLPSNLQCEEGERLLLSCQVMVGGPCQIRWFTNEILIAENASRTRRHYNPDTGICFIIVDPIFTSDSGVYRLIIANRYGQAQSTCQVKILARQIPPMPDDDQMLRLQTIQSLPSNPIVCRDGDTIQLICIFHGRRPIQIRWFKDEQEIRIDDRQQQIRQIYFDQLTGRATLIIHDVFPNDSGVYRCEASNDQGRESTSTTVDVTRM